MPKISLPLVGYFLKIFLSFPCPDIFINLDLSSNKGALLLQLIPIIGLILTDLLLYTICCENAALSGLNSLPHPLRISLGCFFFLKKNDPLRRLTSPHSLRTLLIVSKNFPLSYCVQVWWDCLLLQNLSLAFGVLVAFVLRFIWRRFFSVTKTFFKHRKNCKTALIQVFKILQAFQIILSC